ncbi:MAG: hypothetical protein H6719_13420 [Sandaracinaceae bacterium]|nr:hypothetical protein [Sandaracinaceae bacterium]
MRWAPCFACFALLGCSNVDVVAVGGDAETIGRDAGEVPLCEGVGPPVLVGDGPTGRTLCGGTVAERTFRYALCSCRGIAFSTPVHTDSFDSRVAPFMAPGGRGGAVGSNGGAMLSDAMSFGGSLWVAGAAGVSAPASGSPVDVAGELRSGGPYASASSLDVTLDAFVAGDVTTDALTVGGALVTPAGATVTASSEAVGERRTEPVVVPPPCDCDPSVLLDVRALVRARATDHDDAMAGVTPQTLRDYAGDVRVELPCGRFYFDGVAGTGALTLAVTGRAAVYVAGDLAPGGAFRVEVADGGELDLFVEGILTSSSDIAFGSPDAPARTRLYLGGSGAVTLAGTSTFAGNVYAPRADLSTSGLLDVYGSIFVGGIAASGGVSIHYDTAVLDVGADCPADPIPCDSCRDCRNQACVDGACVACTSNDQCCSPLLCIAGRCQIEPF